MFRKLLVSILASIGLIQASASEIDFNNPLVEFPDGELQSSKAAIIKTLKILNSHSEIDRWLGIFAQGAGYVTSEVHVKLPYLRIEGGVPNFEVLLVGSGISLKGRSIELTTDNKFDISAFTEIEQALIVNTLFLDFFQVKPFEGESDFALGVEWL